MQAGGWEVLPDGRVELEGGWEGGRLLFIVSSEGLLESLHRI